MKPFPYAAFCALLLGGVAIGFGGILMRLSDVNAIASAFWRLALAAPLLWIWAARTGASDRRAGKRTEVAAVLVWSGALFAIELGIWHLSLHYTNIANSTLLANMAPLCIALWLWLRHGQRFTRGFLVGMTLAIVGAIFLVGPSAGLGNGVGAGHLVGDGLALLSTTFYAAYQLMVKAARVHYSTARLMAWSSTISALVLLPWALATSGPFWPGSAAAWLPLVALALVAQLGGQTVIAYAFAHLPSSLASISLLIQPLTAAVAAWALFGEAIGPLRLCGGALLLCGIYLSKRGST